jgi:serine/threonine protein kinase/Flp pilus assembly protein TadD
MCAAPLVPRGELAATRSIGPAAPDPARSALFAGKYVIVKELGQGGMGIVYEAEQQSPKRPVALKVIRGGSFVSETEVRMFQREAQALARLKHPHIAAVYESGRTEDGRPYFAMELVRGETLTGYLAPRGASGKLAPDEIRFRLRLFREVCDAVNYAHQRSIIHRDLKPSNILVQSGPDAPRGTSDPVPEVKVLDFGLARITETDLAASALVTEAGRIMGTVPYMSPEQIRGNTDEIDVRSDVYSLGVVLYEMLTGVLPYDLTRASLTTMARAIVEEPPRPLAKSWRGARKPDADLQTIAAKAIEKEPARRYQSAGALSEDIERYLHKQPILARPPSGIYQLRKLVARHKVGFGFAVAFLVLLAGFALTMTILSARIARERTRAEQEAAKAKAINEFLLETMGSANPVEGAGRDTTVLEALKSAVEKIAPTFSGQPEVEADLSHRIGLTYLRLGHYREAEDLLQSACRILEATFGPEYADLASPLTTLGVLKQERGEYSEAESLYRRALAIARRGKSDEDPDVLSILNNLALLLQDKGTLDEAEALFRRILAIDRKISKPEETTVALDLNNLGNLLLRKDDLAAAEPILREAVAGFEAKGHPWRSFVKGNLAFLLARKGSGREAEAMFAEALPAALKDFGEANQDVAKLRCKYGICLIGLAKYAEAETQLRAALPVLDGSLGRKDEWTQRTLREIVRLYEAWGKPAEAQKYRSLL